MIRDSYLQASTRGELHQRPPPPATHAFSPLIRPLCYSATPPPPNPCLVSITETWVLLNSAVGGWCSSPNTCFHQTYILLNPEPLRPLSTSYLNQLSVLIRITQLKLYKHQSTPPEPCPSVAPLTWMPLTATRTWVLRRQTSVSLPVRS